MRKELGLYFFLLTAFLATPAHAYIGPGVGAGAIAVVFGVIASIFLGLLAILWYPIKRLFRQLKAPAKKSEQGDQEPNELDTDNDSLRHPDRDRDSNASGDGTPGN
jgi:hypothetical protein